MGSTKIQRRQLEDGIIDNSKQSFGTPVNPTDVATKEYVDNQPGGGGAVIKTATITVSGDRQSEFIGTITDAQVVPTSMILIQHGAYSDADENEEEAEDITSISILGVATGSFQVRITAIGPIVGDFNFNYLLS